jgi:hypothetical protein
MATLTVAGVEEALSKYKTVGSSFIQELNLVLPRLYAMGMWRDLLYETVISTTDGNFTLPEGESIVSAMIENDPAKVRSQFHDYRLTGRNNDGVTLAMYGLVDDGFVPTINELDSSKTYKIEVAPIYPETELPRTTNDFITVTGLNNSTTPVAITYEPKIATATSSSVTSTSLFTSIEEIRNGDSSLSAPVRVTAVNSADATDRLHLADVQESNKVSRFRRYRLNNNVSLTVTKTMRLLVKRKFKTLINSYDPVYPSNLNAIKHGLLGTVAEDNADIERANYHWAICKQLLDEELDAYRGAAKPTIIFDPSGSNSRVPNIL